MTTTDQGELLQSVSRERPDALPFRPTSLGTSRPSSMTPGACRLKSNRWLFVHFLARSSPSTLTWPAAPWARAWGPSPSDAAAALLPGHRQPPPPPQPVHNPCSREASIGLCGWRRRSPRVETKPVQWLGRKGPGTSSAPVADRGEPFTVAPRGLLAPMASLEVEARSPESSISGPSADRSGQICLRAGAGTLTTR